ncbi:ABC transporter permease [Stenotrophomonas maltophilia]|jgi:lipopolysaccharide transport system permease protein|nr:MULTISPECIES: ABC transporter permease [Stenotrophomonas]MBA0221702.1 ABC transporter permease [Stenotrophomonas maltophilia]MBE5270222.1 ABC transporter permease [Stenotrophomonas sp. B2]MBH1593016.1 ABC transporter permease [Stenotrophomonas maltophilia]MBH1665602.1 ABC transporter permease [Stenotrophomonas maltophilia]MBH1836252.1 ABC transporter permease [Stenotrophomonas maltophilia]
MLGMLKALWNYRYFIFSSIKNELRLRFIRSRLGALWMIIHPLMQVLIFATILSEVLAAKLPGIDDKYGYALYLMSGTLCWTMFSETIGKSVNLFVDSGNLMKKMSFPRICLPFIAGGTMLVNNVLLLVAIFAVFAVMGHMPTAEALWLPALMLLTLSFSMALGLLLGVLNVFMRDIGQVVPVVLQALFWLTPIVYHITILPERVQAIFRLNPLLPLVTSYQNVLLFDKPPVWGDLLWLMIATVVLALASLVMFRRASPEMVDAL